ncbi:hypothetical protein GH714_024099 [Hevea brasiliensis]|uniref:SWIB domain-containing protein n=1 Tax=Hevea brasiliensis TaxID=3981 RepID=A0A6A6MCU0_HEVBR|nr:hypothetical protein GH714_024099 [Hevea brasiliensis]
MINNNPAKSLGAPSAVANSGAITQSVPLNKQSPHLLSQSQPQTQGGSAFPGHSQLSEPQAQVLGHSQYAQAAHAHFQAQIQSTNQSIAKLQNPNPSNAGVSSNSVSTPGTASAKKANQKQPSRKKQKLPEKQIPDKVAAILPESALYTQLLEFEARIYAAMERKKMDIQESLKNPPHIRKTLRVYIFNTFENQKQGEKKNNAEPPSWSLKIFGKILEDGKDPVLAGMPQKPYPKFSSYFKKITICLDQSLYPDNHAILWESARSPVLNEGFEVKRRETRNSLQ